MVFLQQPLRAQVDFRRAPNPTQSASAGNRRGRLALVVRNDRGRHPTPLGGRHVLLLPPSSQTFDGQSPAHDYPPGATFPRGRRAALEARTPRTPGSRGEFEATIETIAIYARALARRTLSFHSTEACGSFRKGAGPIHAAAPARRNPGQCRRTRRRSQGTRATSRRSRAAASRHRTSELQALAALPPNLGLPARFGPDCSRSPAVSRGKRGAHAAIRLTPGF